VRAARFEEAGEDSRERADTYYKTDRGLKALRRSHIFAATPRIADSIGFD
jgi:hypothetical protein